MAVSPDFKVLPIVSGAMHKGVRLERLRSSIDVVTVATCMLVASKSAGMAVEVN